jgi:twitching motility protein PilT
VKVVYVVSQGIAIDKWFFNLLQIAEESRATDIHLGPGSCPLFRISKRLVRISSLPKISDDSIKQIVSMLLTDSQYQQLTSNHVLDYSFSVNGLGRFRVNIYSQRNTYAITIRILPFTIPSLDELGLDKLSCLVKETRGLVLVTGVTGSGKSTTLASIINAMNCECEYHIITIEDPIEYLHKHKNSFVTQRELGSDVVSFSHALWSALRQDPDVIMVGEMRDIETVSIALRAAETGRLVLSTLHTLGVASTVSRIVDMFPLSHQQQIRVQLSDVLRAVVSQQLIPTSDGSNLVVASELMLTNNAISNLLRDSKPNQIYSAMQSGSVFGMYRMEEELVRLYRSGFITFDNAHKYALDVSYLKILLGRGGN